jgi:hypothetical protein
MYIMAPMGERRNVYRILGGKAGRKETTGTILKWILER